jgi:hypothetical protein
MKIKVNELEYEFKFMENNDEMPAIMTLIIGQFKVKGFRVMKTKFEDNDKRFVLYPPANRTGGGKWIKIFWTDVKEDWSLLEKEALEQFDKEHTEYLLNNSVSDNLDNIKF